MTRCEQLRNRLAEYALGGLKGRARSRLEAHLRQCAACRAELAALERTGALLDGCLPLAAPEATWEAISRRIAQGAATVTHRLRWAWGAAASALTVALIVIAFFIARPDVTSPMQVAMSPPPADEEMAAAIEGRIPAAWAAPLSDEAAVGLRFMSTEDGG